MLPIVFLGCGVLGSFHFNTFLSSLNLNDFNLILTDDPTLLLYLGKNKILKILFTKLNINCSNKSNNQSQPKYILFLSLLEAPQEPRLLFLLDACLCLFPPPP